MWGREEERGKDREGGGHIYMERGMLEQERRGREREGGEKG